MEKDNKQTGGLSVFLSLLLFVFVVTIVVALAGIVWWLWPAQRPSTWDGIGPILLGCAIAWVLLFVVSGVGYLLRTQLIRQRARTGIAGVAQVTNDAQTTAPLRLFARELRDHLRAVYTFFW
ncbi:hypothetical protein, partial [Tenebrionibacter intestinalis]